MTRAQSNTFRPFTGLFILESWARVFVGGGPGSGLVFLLGWEDVGPELSCLNWTGSCGRGCDSDIAPCLAGRRDCREGEGGSWGKKVC